MTMYSISLDGIHNAALRLDRAARNIAQGRSFSASSEPVLGDSIELSSPSQTEPEFNPVDYAREMVNVLDAKTGYRANLKAVTVQSEMDEMTLDLLA